MPDMNMTAKTRRFMLRIVPLAVIALGALPTVFGLGCFWREITGMPCPTCGMSRAAALFLSGRFTEAFAMHPLIFLLFPLVLFWFAIVLLEYRRYRRAEDGSSFFAHLSGSVWLTRTAIGMVALTFAVYLIRLPFYFPENDPLSWNERAWLPTLIRLIGAFFRV